MVKVQDNKGQFKITIPKDIVKLKKWKNGTELAIILDEDLEVKLKEIGGKR